MYTFPRSCLPAHRSPAMKNGFTLIEMMVTLSILAIVAVMAA
ncbi:type II secretion system protein, partial [Craterilacuibacter sp.]